MTTAEQHDADTAAVEEFAGRMIGLLNDACTALMASIGHRTGLFDAMAGRGALTSEELARAAGLNERYVREWLNAMTTARIVTYEPDLRSYELPAEHAALLTTAAGPDNLAKTMQFVTLLAEVEQRIVQCFRQGGGLSYADFPGFHALMTEESAAVVDAALVDVIVPLVPGLAARLEEGIDVADVGCGSGHAINVLAATYPGSRFAGWDFSESAIQQARAEAAGMELTNATFDVVDAAHLDAVAAYDLITAFDAIHDQAHPAQVLAGIHQALRPGGVFLMVDIRSSSKVEENLDLPWASFLYTVSTMHCMTVSLGLGGDGLGTAWGYQLATSMLQDAGFGRVDVKEVETDPFNNYYVCYRA